MSIINPAFRALRLVCTAFSLFAGTAGRAYAQSPDSLAAKEYVSYWGERGRYYYAAMLMSCPSTSARSDSIFSTLLSVPTNDTTAGDLANGWGTKIRECEEPRLDAWFRSHLAATTHPGLARPLIRGLTRHPTPENVAAVRSFAWRPEIDSSVRNLTLQHLASVLPPQQRTELYLEAFAKNVLGSSAEYRVNEAFHLARSTYGDHFREALLNGVLIELQNPHAGYVLIRLADDLAPRGEQSVSDKWRLRLRSVLDSLSKRQDIPIELRNSAEYASTTEFMRAR